MDKKFNISYLLNQGVNIFSTDWKLLVGIYIILFLPIYLLLFWSKELNIIISSALVLLLGLFSIAFLILLNKNVEKRFIKNKTYFLKDYIKDLKKTYWKTLLTILLVFLITILVELAIIIVFAIITIILASIFSIPTTMEKIVTSPWVLLAIAFVIISILAMMLIGIFLFFTSSITILTDKKYLGSIKESIRIIKTNGMKVVWIIILFQIIVSIISNIIKNIFLSFGSNAIINTLGSIFGQIIIMPFTISMIVWYILLSKNKK